MRRKAFTATFRISTLSALITPAARFIALGKLEEFGKTVRPHETTLSKPKMDRLLLTRATAAQIGLIFMLYKDEEKVADKIIEKASKGKPLIDFVG